MIQRISDKVADDSAALLGLDIGGQPQFAVSIGRISKYIYMTTYSMKFAISVFHSLIFDDDD